MYEINATDFENLRIALMGNYNSQSTAHVGYIIALAVGVAAVLYQIDFKTFVNDYSRLKRSLFFYLPISALFGSMVYVFFRLLFWAWMSGEVLRVPISEVSKQLSMNANDNTYTAIWGIQDYCSKAYLNVGGWSSSVYAFYKEALSASILLIILFSFLTFVAISTIDISTEKTGKYFNKRGLRKKQSPIVYWSHHNKDNLIARLKKKLRLL